MALGFYMLLVVFLVKIPDLIKNYKKSFNNQIISVPLLKFFHGCEFEKKPEIVSRHGKSCSALKGLIDTNLIFSFLPVHINVLLTVKLIKFHGIPSRQCCTACFAAYRNIPPLPTWE